MCVLLSLDGGDQSSSGPYLFGLFLVRIQAFHLISAVQCLPSWARPSYIAIHVTPILARIQGYTLLVLLLKHTFFPEIYSSRNLLGIYSSRNLFTILSYLYPLILRSKLTKICWISLIVFQQHTNEQLHDSLSLVLLSSRRFFVIISTF